jgi:hypothetical protein
MEYISWNILANPHIGEIGAGRQPNEDILGDNLLFLLVCGHVLHYFFD